MRVNNQLDNPNLADYPFLAGMYDDDYFPKPQVDLKAILLELCVQIETDKPATPDALLKLTHAATERINDLQEDFEEHDSEIETVARESSRRTSVVRIYRSRHRRPH